MMAIEDDDIIVNSIFSLMVTSDDEDDAPEVTLFELKDDLGNLSTESLRKLAVLIIGSVDELSNKNLMLTKKLSLLKMKMQLF